MPKMLTPAAVTLTAAMLLGACGGSPTSSSTTSGSVQVVASFYPLAYAVEQIGAGRVEVNTLTGPGQDPHHVELTPRQVASVSDASLVVYERGMQPAADSAIEGAGAANTLDLSSLATLPASATQDISAPTATATHDDHDDHEHDHAATSASAATATTDTHDDHDDHDGHNHGTMDPHFWLDPQQYSAAVGLIADKLAAVDPEGAETYRANATAFQAKIAELDTTMAAGLASCTQRDLVTGHTAFAYLAKRYNLQQVGISGVLNAGEPDPARLASIASYITTHKIGTIYNEEGETGAAVDTVAHETGAATATLDSLSITKDGGYVERMTSNLTTLRTGQKCS